ncbi:MAG: PQQ-binding-like beta-propeller repeat protein [Verrucomicrobiales bacterium]|nr:PQQ-binding-like beta-propeller repeat protein [Verrucomicrobiales bacterium]
MNLRFGSTLLLLAGLASFPVFPQNWPMLGGAPQRNMVSAMTGLPESWDVKSGKNIKWKAQLGSTSYGNPVVADGKIFLGTNNGNPRNPSIQGDRGVLMCFRESDGKFLWQAVTDKLASGLQNDFPEQGVCSSPAVDGKRLYYVSNRGELVCLDTEGLLNGKNDGPFRGEVHKGPSDADIVWKLDMMKELDVYPRNMANSSPVIWEDLVFVETSNGRGDDKVPSPKAPSFLAVNKNTGKVVWQDNSPGDGILRGQWSSPALGLVDGTLQAFFPGGDGWLYGFNARTGERLWKFDLNPKEIGLEDRNYGISMPVFSEGKVIMSAGQDPDNGSGRGAAYSINPAKRGDITESGRVWHYEKINRSLSTAAVGGGLAFLADIDGILHCLDAETGKPYWTFDVKSPVWGSPLLADGKVYLGDEDGDLSVFRANSKLEKPTVIDMADSIYSTPVPANGVLYVMTRTQLYAITANKIVSGN